MVACKVWNQLNTRKIWLKKSKEKFNICKIYLFRLKDRTRYKRVLCLKNDPKHSFTMKVVEDKLRENTFKK
jgi:hypothetical protein